MGYRLNALVLVVSAGVASADPAPLDVKDQLPHMWLFDDGHHHYVIYARMPGTDALRGRLYYGDGAKFFRLETEAGSLLDVKKSAMQWTMGDERYTSLANTVEGDPEEGKLRVRCDKRSTNLSRTPPAEEKRILAAATFSQREPHRYPQLLGRDDELDYVYVDLPIAGGNNPDSVDYRLYYGKRGALKRYDVRDQAVDSGGSIFITAAGTLKTVAKTGAMSWIPAGKPPRELTPLSVETERRLVYGALGVYATQRFGTPCDDL